MAEKAAARGLTALALTDHDTLEGILSFCAAAESAGIRAVPGVEISVEFQGRERHLLAYFVDPDAEELGELLRRSREDRKRRAEEIGEKLAALGVEIDAAETNRRARGAATRAHMARALKEAGHVATSQEAFERWLLEGRPAYAPRRLPSLREAALAAKRAGGVVALAHPTGFGEEDVRAVVEEGVEAIEATHPSIKRARSRELRRIAEKYFLHVVGGSDYHGAPPDESNFGAYAVREEAIDKMLEWRERRPPVGVAPEDDPPDVLN